LVHGETRGRLKELVRQQQNGEHNAAHNIWIVPLGNGWARPDWEYCE
jgi:hypothetical protein